MTRTEHLLVILAEECNEVAHRIAKTLRFGALEIEPGQTLNNCERIEQEMSDLIGVWNMLRDMGHLKPIEYLQTIDKSRRVEKFLDKSKACGTLNEIIRPME